MKNVKGYLERRLKTLKKREEELEGDAIGLRSLEYASVRARIREIELALHVIDHG